MGEIFGLETGKEKVGGAPYYGHITAVNNYSECGGSFYFEAMNGSSVKGFWVLENQDYALIARIAKLIIYQFGLMQMLKNFLDRGLKRKTFMILL